MGFSMAIFSFLQEVYFYFDADYLWPSYNRLFPIYASLPLAAPVPALAAISNLKF